jgi:hypothetical protein
VGKPLTPSRLRRDGSLNPIAIGEGFSHILTKKGIERASGDVGLIMTNYNIRRIINIIGIKELKKYLKTILAFIFEKTGLSKSFLSHLNLLVYRTKKIFRII